MERISITLPKKLLSEFDDILEETGYSSRSEGIRDALRSYILEHGSLKGLKGDVAGTITMVYDHDEAGTLEKLTEFQHEFSGLIDSSLHIHLDQKHCLEVIVVRGRGEKIKTLVDKLSSTKGIKRVKLTASSSEIPS
ncbi:MAG: nickel-responsive transcriptional regulator NikR [Candidatus Hydrothermarchaeales archaeon]